MAAWFIHLIICTLMGWGAAHALRADRQHRVGMNSLAGLGGAWLGGLLVNGGLISREPSFLALLAAFAGALVIVAVVNLIRKGRIRL